MFEQPTPDHAWLQQLLGDWTAKVEMTMGPDQPPTITTGAETFRELGPFWVLGEGTMGCGDGNSVGRNLMTLGYDPRTQRFVGSFISSMMSHLWPYEGSLGESGKVLTLDSTGPSFAGDGTMAKYQDIIEFINPNHRTLTSRYLEPSGSWRQFMVAHYHRAASPSS